MNIKLQDLTFDIVKQLFADKLNQKYGQLNFPNASDSTTTVRDERDLANWKQGIMNGYGNVELELDPEGANSREQIKVLDPKFQANKDKYINTKASYLDSERSAGRTSGLDEELINEFGPDAKDEMSPSEYIQYCLERYREYRILAADPTINDQAAKLYSEKAMDYYVRAQEAMDEIEPDMTDHLSDEDKALPNKSLADQEAEAMYERFEKLAGLKEESVNKGKDLIVENPTVDLIALSTFAAVLGWGVGTVAGELINRGLDWWDDYKDDKNVNKIINRIKGDPEVQEFVKNPNKRGWREMLKKKLSPNEQNYIKRLYKDSFALKEEYSSTDFDTYKIGDQIELDPSYFQAFEMPDGYIGTITNINQADYADETPVYTVALKNIDPFGDEHEDISVEYKQVK
jgi:hypothetical protein